MLRRPFGLTDAWNLSTARMFSTKLEQIVGKSGRRYSIIDVMQDKRIPLGRVYLAMNNNAEFVIKEIPQDFDKRSSVYDRVSHHDHIRGMVDAIPDKRMFVFDYLNQNLLELARRILPLVHTKRILKSALEGLVALHELDLVHNDIKPNNVMIQTTGADENISIEKVHTIDLEDAVHLQGREALRGAQIGNWMWRSPEAHAEGPMRKSSDIFSFGIVCVYAMTKDVIFAVNQEELPVGVHKLAVVLERQISYFADEAGLAGFLRYIGAENPWHEIFQVVNNGFGENRPRRPFSSWQGTGLDETFKDLIGGLTNFDPLKRLIAQEAVEHAWFKDC